MRGKRNVKRSSVRAIALRHGGAGARAGPSPLARGSGNYMTSAGTSSTASA